VALIPDGLIPREAQIRLNLPVLLFSLGTAVFTAVLVGLVPALQAARKNLVEPLRDAGKGVSGGFRRGRLRSTLVVVEVALSVVLLSGAGLLMRKFRPFAAGGPGIPILTISCLRGCRSREASIRLSPRNSGFSGRCCHGLQALPGVVAATETTTVPPFGGIRSDIEIYRENTRGEMEAIFQLVQRRVRPNSASATSARPHSL